MTTYRNGIKCHKDKSNFSRTVSRDHIAIHYEINHRDPRDPNTNDLDLTPTNGADAHDIIIESSKPNLNV